MTDQQLLISKIRDAGRIIAEHLEPTDTMPQKRFPG
jgi:hypothetical protein